MPAMASRMRCPGRKLLVSRACSCSSLEFQYTCSPAAGCLSPQPSWGHDSAPTTQGPLDLCQDDGCRKWHVTPLRRAFVHMALSLLRPSGMSQAMPGRS